MVDNCYGEFVESIEPPAVVCDVAFILLLKKGSIFIFFLVNGEAGCRSDCR